MPEVNTAINMGYEILCIYEVLHWEQNDKQLRAQFSYTLHKHVFKNKSASFGVSPQYRDIEREGKLHHTISL